jgi:serine beta-lactamase-like protein LACTB, mitochondrial
VTSGTLWRAAAALFGCLVVTWMLIIAGAQHVVTIPIHQNAAAVRSTAGTAAVNRYARAIEESRQLARALVASDNLPGLSAAVAVNGELVWADAFGWSDVEIQTRLTPQTRFRLGAASKPVTAVAAALLSDRGRLDLDLPVQRYLPEYPEKQWPITTRQLMGDIGGVQRLRGDNRSTDSMPVTHCDSLDDAVAMVRDDPLRFEPGTEYRYSIWSWVLVSAVVERAAGESFERFMSHSVLAPLGMTRTVLEETSDLDDGPSRHVPPRSFFGIRLAPKEADRPDYSCLFGGGAFLSTPADLVRLGSTMVKPGFLTPHTIAEFETAGRLKSGAATTYALGWTVGTVPLADGVVWMISHRGSPRGGTVSLLAFPDLGLVVAAASNVDDARGVNPFALKVAEAFTRR